MSSSSKGGLFERNVSKKLTKWASGKEKPLWYWRTAGSGAQACITGDTKSTMVGDIMPLIPEAKFLTDIFVFECKDRKNANILDFISQPKSDSVWSWWNENCFDCIGTKKRRPFLIFHRPKSSQDYCCIQQFVYMKLMATGAKFGRVLTYNKIAIINFDNFLNGIKPWKLATVLSGLKIGKKVKRNYNKSY